MTTDPPPAFEESSDLEMIRRTAREVADGMASGEFWADAAAVGFLGTPVPSPPHASGAGVRELSAVVEELARRGCMGVGVLFVVTVCFGGMTLANYGTEAQKERILPELVDGEHLFCMALTEPDAGHNVPNMGTFAEREGEAFVSDGSKQWISGTDRADTMLLVARTRRREAVEKRTQGVTLFLVDPDDPAIELREIDVGIPAPEKQFEVSIDGYRADEDDVVRTEGMGL